MLSHAPHSFSSCIQTQEVNSLHAYTLAQQVLVLVQQLSLKALEVACHGLCACSMPVFRNFVRKNSCRRGVIENALTRLMPAMHAVVSAFVQLMSAICASLPPHACDVRNLTP